MNQQYNNLYSKFRQTESRLSNHTIIIKQLFESNVVSIILDYLTPRELFTNVINKNWDKLRRNDTIWKKFFIETSDSINHRFTFVQKIIGSKRHKCYHCNKSINNQYKIMCDCCNQICKSIVGKSCMLFKFHIKCLDSNNIIHHDGNLPIYHCRLCKKPSIAVRFNAWS